MATYTQLRDLSRNQQLADKIVTAIMVAIDTVRLEAGATPNHTERLAWAKVAVGDPISEAQRFTPLVLAKNKGVAASAISGASDAAIQTNVDDLIDFFAV